MWEFRCPHSLPHDHLVATPGSQSQLARQGQFVTVRVRPSFSLRAPPRDLAPTSEYRITVDHGIWFHVVTFDSHPDMI